jgi:hypothetical protein
MIRVFCVVGVLVLLQSSFAFADSCTDWKGYCLASYTGSDQTGAMRKCTEAMNTCKAQCKRG